ncbi:MAG: SagB/ThcOx family dehydrogenase [Acidobacteria bacterium]|nr:SagB/ThcOx family dehydrogenase [Acidobacteriota bacterium]
MNNRKIDLIWKYHNATKHSDWSVRAGGHFLDWANYPLPFKIYPDLEPIPLLREWLPSGMDAFSALSAKEPAESAEAIPDLKTLASILYHSAGITRHRQYPGGEIYYRAAACTGALYEIELYWVCGPLPELEAGVYHFSPADFALRRLRSGDYRAALAQATGREPSVSQAPLILVCTGTYWRNAWKYQARTYRHFYWDNGTILANLLAMTAALRLPAQLVLGFVDDPVNQLLGLDTEREVSLSLVSLGQNSSPEAAENPEPPEFPEAVEPLNLRTIPYSSKEVDYPLMRETHAACALSTPEEVAAWRGQTSAAILPEAAGQTFSLVEMQNLPTDSIEPVILRRGSSRQFARKPIRLDQLSTLLLQATGGIAADFLEPFGAHLNDLYLIVNAVEGLPPGAYFFRRDRHALELLKEGDFREQAGYLGLEQQLPADASVDIFFLADLNVILDRYGNRGYRATQLEAGILGGKLYLASYAQKLGATGLTFYDDEVTQFFSPHAAGKSAIFLVAIGVPAKRPLPML